MAPVYEGKILTRVKLMSDPHIIDEHYSLSPQRDRRVLRFITNLLLVSERMHLLNYYYEILA